jgi:hypothetical protein
VASLVSSLFNCKYSDIPSYPDKGNFFVSLASQLPAPHPCYLVMRFDKVFDEDANRRITLAWDILSDSGLRVVHRKVTRDTSPQCHLGVWEHYAQQPRATAESLAQVPETITAMDNFLSVLKIEVISKLFSLLYRYDQNLCHRQQM